MPQMSPIMWLVQMLYNLMLLILMISIIFYSTKKPVYTQPKSNMSLLSPSSTSVMVTKWKFTF